MWYNHAMDINNTLYTLNTNIFNDTGLYEDIYSQLPKPRQEKIDRFRFENDKKLSLGAGYLLKRALEEIGINDFTLEYRQREKPYIAGHSDVFFNLSHSGEMACLALSGSEVGVDIEKETHFKDNHLNYVFSEKDLSLAKDLMDMWKLSEDQIFTRLWTVKESIMKYSGAGIALAPKKILLSRSSLSQDKCCFEAFSEGFDCSDLTISCYDIPGYQLSVCSKYDNFTIKQGSV
ncbi:MAG: 4'-phosphopantetheinyl transferase superfamily protein [Butyrivibrio sp.]|nr:4'-phosphopantetheinyl transferase superfamily protein [Butyrivibrio sp.]